MKPLPAVPILLQASESGIFVPFLAHAFVENYLSLASGAASGHPGIVAIVALKTLRRPVAAMSASVDSVRRQAVGAAESAFGVETKRD